MLETDFEKLSFKGAVRPFKEWGFLVEQGPGHGEVTFILEGRGHRSYHVYRAAELPEMAAAILAVRWRTGAVMATVRRVQ